MSPATLCALFLYSSLLGLPHAGDPRDDLGSGLPVELPPDSIKLLRSR
jgi:hypothetical protein